MLIIVLVLAVVILIGLLFAYIGFQFYKGMKR